MAETNNGVIAQARAAAPQAVAPAVTPTPVVAAPAQPAAGFGEPASQNGFAQPVAPVVQPIAAPATTVDNSRTTQQFEKLTESNQRMAQQIDALQQQLTSQLGRRQQTNTQFAPIQQVAPAAQPAATPKLDDYIEIDPTTGEQFVNRGKFDAAMAEVFQKASRAEETVQKYVQTSEQREIARQESEAYQTYPQLRPGTGDFDGRFSQQTRAIIYDSLMHPLDYGGRSLSFKEAADFVRSATGQPVTPNVATPTVNVENQGQKEQAAANVPSTPQRVSENIDAEAGYQRLVQGTRLGSDQAIAVRLKNANHRIDDIEGS